MSQLKNIRDPRSQLTDEETDAEEVPMHWANMVSVYGIHGPALWQIQMWAGNRSSPIYPIIQTLQLGPYFPKVIRLRQEFLDGPAVRTPPFTAEGAVQSGQKKKERDHKVTRLSHLDGSSYPLKGVCLKKERKGGKRGKYWKNYVTYYLSLSNARPSRESWFSQADSIRVWETGFPNSSRVSFCKGRGSTQDLLFESPTREKNKTSLLVLPSEEDQGSPRLKQFKHKVH